MTWSHYRVLLSVQDDKQRLLLARQAGKEGWTVGELEAGVRSLAGNNKGKPPRLPEPRRGILHTYRIVKSKADDEALLDQGFRNFDPAPRNIPLDAIVEYDPASGKLKPSGRGPGDLYTYEAKIVDVVDGDTVWVEVLLAFDRRTRQVLRLRGVDAPEADSPEGKKAKRFVEKVLSQASTVLLASSRSDKYDRYLADIFYQAPDGERYLNRELLARGLASSWRG